MIFNRSRPLPDLCAEFTDVTLRHDVHAAAGPYRRIERGARRARASELTAGLTALVPAVRQVPFADSAPVVHLVTALIGHGADPATILGPLVERTATALESTAERPRHGTVHHVFGAPLVVDAWTHAVGVPLQQRRVRQALPHRARLTAAATSMAGELPNADWLLGLLHVVDDDALLVLHRGTGRGYELTISGVGNNRQFQMLLAAALIGDPAQGLLPLPPPVAAWVAAATTGEPRPRAPFEDRFSLADVSGAPIGDDRRPADFTVVDGRRVVVLDTPPYTAGWTAGRPYADMVPEIRLDRVLPPDEAAAWAARVSPPQPR